MVVLGVSGNKKRKIVIVAFADIFLIDVGGIVLVKLIELPSKQRYLNQICN